MVVEEVDELGICKVQFRCHCPVKSWMIHDFESGRQVFHRKLHSFRFRTVYIMLGSDKRIPSRHALEMTFQLSVIGDGGCEGRLFNLIGVGWLVVDCILQF